MPYHVSSELRNLIDRMLDVDAATRITMEGVVSCATPQKNFFNYRMFFVFFFEFLN